MALSSGVPFSYANKAYIVNTGDEDRGTVIGLVTDAESGEPLPGASVSIQGTSLGGATNAEGRFRIRRVPVGEQIVVATFLGFEVNQTEITVRSNEQIEVEIGLGSASVDLGELTVRGRLSGQSRALNQQRTSRTIQNVLSQEQMQQYADPNVSDALRRVPGVSTFEHRGESSSIFIRGMSPNLNVVTLDGERLATTGTDNRETSLLGIDSEMVGSIEVAKAITPAMDADATGGTINLVANRPVGDQRIFNASLEGGAHRYADAGKFGASVNYGQSIGDFSYMIRLNARRDNRIMDDVRHFWQDQEIDGHTQQVLGQLRLGAYEIMRDRYSASTRVDYRLSSEHSLFARGLINYFDKQGERQQYRVRPESGTYLSHSESHGGRVEPIGRRNRLTQTIGSLTAGGSSVFDNLNVDYSATYSRGHLDQPYQEYLRWRNPNIDISFDDTNIGINSFASYEFINGTAASADDPSQFFLTRYEDRVDDVTDDDINLKVDADLPFSLGNLVGELQAGGRYFSKLKQRSHRIMRHSELPDDAAFFMDAVASSDHYRPIVNNTYSIGRYSPWNTGEQFRNQHWDIIESALDRNSLAEFSDADDYRAREIVRAGYAMATLDHGPWTFLGGLRTEHTQTSYRGMQTQLNEEGEHLFTEEFATDQSYLNFFPMAHLTYRLGNRSNLRLAWTNTLARPNFTDLAPYRIINEDNQQIDEGNANLQPAQAMHFDLMAEHYFTSLGLASAGIFYKNLSDFIYRDETQLADGPYEGFLRSRPENGDQAHVYGVELAVQHQLDFLPGVLSGIGVQANYTYTGSRAMLQEVDDDRDLPLPRIIPHTVNLALSYETGGFTGLVSANHQSTYLYSVSTAQVSDHRSHLYPTLDRYLQAQTRIDARIQQQVLPGARVYMEANNLTNSGQTWWDGAPVNHYRTSYNYRSMTLGVRYSL